MTTTKTSKMTTWMLPAAIALAACNGTVPSPGDVGDAGPDAGDAGPDAGDAGPDLCTHSVDVTQKLENVFVVYELDAGLPMGIDTASEIAQCEQKLDAGCDAQDETTLNAAVTCIDELPPIECAWFMPDGGVSPAALLWALVAYGCKPGSLSPSCQVLTGLPLDAGLPF